jgi:hypothetical protein
LIVVSQLYNAEITAGSLLLKESRVVAQLLLQGADNTAWQRAIMVDNVLQKTSPASAKRMATLIRKRLDLMPRELWTMVAEGTTEVATQSLLAATIKHSRLFGDFMLQVLPNHYRSFDHKLLRREWDSFLTDCAHVDPAVTAWSPSTKIKVGQVAYRILAEAGYLDNARSLNLLPVSIAPEVSRFLYVHNEHYILKCMEIAHE